MKDNFPNCISFSLKAEGGYVNDPKDPGGETKYGISKRAYPSVDIKALTLADAIAIYKRDYWDKVQGDTLPAGVDMILLDAAINSGSNKSIKLVQRALGIKDDGSLGPVTLSAILKADPTKLINDSIEQRLAFLKSLPTWGRYGKGWTTRLHTLNDYALGMVHTRG